jgi:CheY-like chemotaxis protein
MTAIRLLIVDDHPIMRDGLCGVFRGDEDFEVVGEASDGAEAVRLAQSLAPDVILMDLRMPGMGGVEAIAQLRERRHPARVLILTTYDTDRDEWVSNEKRLLDRADLRDLDGILAGLARPRAGCAAPSTPHARCLPPPRRARCLARARLRRAAVRIMTV